MTLTPLDIEKLDLRIGFRGFVREDVERFRYDALRSVEDYLARIGALQARVAELERDLAQYRANEDLLKSSVVLAQKTSDELITAARQRAELIVREAEAEGEAIRRRLADIRNEREQFEYAFHGLLSGFLHRLEQGNPTLKPASAAEAQLALASGGAGQPRPGVDMSGGGVAAAKWPAAVAPVAAAPAGQAAKTEAVQGPTPLTEQFTPPAQPAPQPSPTRQVHEHDADIGSFSAALESAPVHPSPPRLSAREHGAAVVEELASVGEPDASLSVAELTSPTLEQGVDQAEPLRAMAQQLGVAAPPALNLGVPTTAFTDETPTGAGGGS